ncbi:phage head closure protein [Limnohabitans radicicola]|uniref:Phage head closure protein n=1 Tax=Limnohabitans radicicola TaxID=2771427 RepID=A0A927FH33_9BURK|nr:phage head closure protein [Limnohabitans radicicola]MBD8051329.1 phage head closure protein [Limnohabitans radicicola]
MTRLRTGELNRRVTLQRRNAAQDSFGEVNAGWVDVQTIWSAIQPLSGRELELAQKVASEVTHRLTIRYQPSLTDTRAVAGMRALYKTRVFNILASMNEDEANVLIHLMVTEGTNEGG